MCLYQPIKIPSHHIHTNLVLKGSFHQDYQYLWKSNNDFERKMATSWRLYIKFLDFESLIWLKGNLKNKILISFPCASMILIGDIIVNIALAFSWPTFKLYSLTYLISFRCDVKVFTNYIFTNYISLLKTSLRIA